MKVFDIVIIGRNVSAITAAIYAGMSNSKTLYINCPDETSVVTGVNRYVGYKEGTYEAFRMNAYKQMSKFNVEESTAEVKKIEIEKAQARIFSNEEILAKTLIISTDETLKLIVGDVNSKFLFRCGNLVKDQTEMIALAGTGCMAAMNARTFIAENN
ncbi:hypothetical protein NEAUS04_1370 [Nematocida ausubeli]|uniref:FAD/NAD(P)-binding domain-containing protein n=1 Tax=Nematocida ausubeli (strain ATCC PRA-371 / ERTm2) TaxID=1913371 RepID=H8ZB45_NEMA1|nr:uncharacterized protein NESG_01348 [Nematocida ausubeli]EHY66098.1 hypothetical protein NERG_00794 [Nematocida ausubeli]KAI5134828.1 hypothetical protein NEAUS06_1329 [Nematocida ausubeli]KAI5136609.1 hypothetical protein NEAUS07_1627 [Nematocida ausubeli]KAI5146786.1 hypothetical protein NEAUS05_0225 [Nematocida ausubeli]KAI5163126.1 hypothetical protein NEAUS04_1370 [Nematocida ausubeli]